MKLVSIIDLILVVVLSLVILSMVVVFLFGLLHPGRLIGSEDDKVLQILGPAFTTLIGWAVGRLGPRPTTLPPTP